MDFKPLSVLVAIGMAALIAMAVFQAGPVQVVPQLADALKPPPAPEPALPKPEQALARGIEFLKVKQSPDGSWRSDVYATFKNGTALTPLVVFALHTANALPDQRKKAAEWLAKMVKPDGSIDEGPDGLPYPVYTAALSVTVLSHPENLAHQTARDAWLKYLLARQLTEENGWSPDDTHYGGWGYYPGIPRKPAPGEIVPAQQLLESNISATAFALDALRAAAHSDEAVWSKAIRFARTCQNEDGGFFLVHGDPVRNKAGETAGRFHSYGSASADGARCLDLPGGGRDGARQKALDWLERHFDPERHPGDYIPAHEPNRDAVHFYYVASLAKTFRESRVTQLNGKPWAGPVATALAKRQQKDGSWANPLELIRENDPILATAYAILALGECQAAGGDPNRR